MVSNIYYFRPFLGKIPILTNIFQMGWNHQLGFLEVTSTSLVPDDWPPFPAKNHFLASFPHRIHGTGIYLPTFTNKNHEKMNHPWIGVYTVRPMGILWVLRLSSIEHDGVLYDNAMDLSTGPRRDNFQGIGRDVPPIPTWAPLWEIPFL